MNQAKARFLRGEMRPRKQWVLRHGHDRVILLSPRRRACPAGETLRRIPRFLARLLRQSLQPLPAGTALYAWPGPGLARQAYGSHGAIGALPSSVLSRPAPHALARRPIARDHGSLPG